MRHQPEGLEQLQAQTKFTKKELQSLYRGFKSVSAQGRVSGSGRSPMGLTWCPFCPPRSAPAAGWTRRPSRSSTRNSSRRAVSGGAPGWCHPPKKKNGVLPHPHFPCLPSADASAYAHFLFTAFDADGSGALCFEVSSGGTPVPRGDAGAAGGRRCHHPRRC